MQPRKCNTPLSGGVSRMRHISLSMAKVYPGVAAPDLPKCRTFSKRETTPFMPAGGNGPLTVTPTSELNAPVNPVLPTGRFTRTSCMSRDILKLAAATCALKSQIPRRAQPAYVHKVSPIGTPSTTIDSLCGAIAKGADEHFHLITYLNDYKVETDPAARRYLLERVIIERVRRVPHLRANTRQIAAFLLDLPHEALLKHVCDAATLTLMAEEALYCMTLML